MSLMELRDLTLAYQECPILRSLSLDCSTNELIVILGANGSGKTTLLKAIAKQLIPKKGQILFEGQSMEQWNRLSVAKLISLMPQFESRETALRVIDVVRLGRIPHRGWLMPLTDQDHQHVERSLRATGIWEKREHLIPTLSGGEWRRMILARALTQDAKVLLLDEPTAGLDLRYQYECLSYVQRSVHERGLLSIVTLHDLNQAAIFADRIVILADQSILAAGTPREVLTSAINVQVIESEQTKRPFVIPLWNVSSTS
jgi:iron complex transport system ATP-binding protein